MINYDPRPLHLRQTSKQEVYDFVRGNQVSSMVHGHLSNWDSIFQITYEDYVLDFDRRMVIYELRRQWIENMRSSLEQYESDELTNEFAFHISGTEMQSDCEEWIRERKGRITASNFETFSKNPQQFLKQFWGGNDVPKSKAMEYGNKNEKNAIKAVEET